MLLSTQTALIGERLGDEKAVQLLCEAGFDALDYSMFMMTAPEHPLNQAGYKPYAENLKQIAAGYGVGFNQAHAPFPSYLWENEEYNQSTFNKILRAIEVASILGAKSIVVHPIYVKEITILKQLNMDFYGRLLPFARDWNIKIALENMWGWDDALQKPFANLCSTGREFADYLDSLDSRYFTACLDLGHCGIVGENAAEMIKILGCNRLKALHVHDNDNFHDTHTAPYFGQTDWDSITTALAEIRYDGDFTFEADNFFLPFPNDLLPDAAKFLCSIGRTLIRAIESKQ